MFKVLIKRFLVSEEIEWENQIFDLLWLIERPERLEKESNNFFNSNAIFVGSFSKEKDVISKK